MTRQLFKKNVPQHILIDFLELVSIKKSKFYIFDELSYKKADYHNLIVPFIDSIKEYYYKSKKYYATRDMTYSRFITIIRHLCKTNNILYTSNITYNKCKYHINYYIYY